MSINNSHLFEPGVDYTPHITINEYQDPPTPSTVDIVLSPTRSHHRFPQRPRAWVSPDYQRPTTRLQTGSLPAPVVNLTVPPATTTSPSARRSMPARKSTASAAASTAPKPTANTKSKRKAPATKAAAAKATAPKATAAKATATKATATKATAPKATASAPKKASTTRKAPPKSSAKSTKTAAKAATTVKASASRKRKADETEDEQEEEASRAPKKVRASKPTKDSEVINQAPTEKLDVYVFGEGSAGELGLGTAKNAIDVKRPRLNPLLSAADVGVVQLSCGGMHVAALTHDNQILTWGVNDDGALGRDTSWDGGLRDMDKDEEDSDDEDSGLNPMESTPTAIASTSFPEGTIFTQVAASDSCTLAVTDTGLVYGWGTFRNSDGILGFSANTKIQKTPALLDGLSKITTVVCGSNSAFALDTKGKAYCWGANPQSQLGYRSIERHHHLSIAPTPLRIRKKIQYIGCGNDHAFAIDDKDQVWAWGSNGHGQTGTRIQRDGVDANVVRIPTKVPNLTRPNDRVIQITGGGFHTIAITEGGTCLSFGRCDNNQMGIDPSTLADKDVAFNDSGNRAAQLVPLPVPNVTRAQFAAAGTDHNIVINGQEEAFSWGFSTNYQTGQGQTDDVLAPTKLENTAVRGKEITWAGCGGQYSIIAGPDSNS